MLICLFLGDYDSFEHIFPKDEPLEKLIKDSKGAHPLVREGRILQVGLWYQNKQILEYTIPKAQMYLARKYPKPDLALVAYMLALHEHDVARARECLETACQITRSARFFCSPFFKKDSSTAGVRAIFPSSTICKIGGISSVKRINLCTVILPTPKPCATLSSVRNFVPTCDEVKSVRKPCRFMASDFIL